MTTAPCILSTNDLPSDPRVSCFGADWYEYLRLLAATEENLLTNLARLRDAHGQRERVIAERKALALRDVAAERDDAGKPLYGNDSTREAAARALLAQDEQYAWAVGERDETQRQLDALGLQIESAKRARRDAHAFLAWGTAYLAGGAR